MDQCKFCNVPTSSNDAGRYFYQESTDYFGSGQGTSCLARDPDGTWYLHYEDSDDTGIMFDTPVDFCYKCGRRLSPVNTTIPNLSNLLHTLIDLASKDLETTFNKHGENTCITIRDRKNDCCINVIITQYEIFNSILPDEMAYQVLLRMEQSIKTFKEEIDAKRNAACTEAET